MTVLDSIAQKIAAAISYSFGTSALVVGFAAAILIPDITSAGAAAPPDPIAFVKGTADEAIGILNNKSLAELNRKAAFRTIILKSFDAPSVGQYVLGSYWAKATPDQQVRFQAVFKEALAQIYIERFFDYDGHSLQVIGTRKGDGGVTVVQTTVGTPTGGTTYNVDWMALASGDHFTMIDVVIDGVSTLSTTKQDYASVLRSTNGDLDGLTTKLSEKVH